MNPDTCGLEILNPDTCGLKIFESGYVWTCKFDLNPNTCGLEIFGSGEKNLRIQNIRIRVDVQIRFESKYEWTGNS